MKVLRDEVRQRILDAARDEFLLSGYTKASMRTIAAQAGMTVGNIYLYFTGKERLFEAVVQEPVAQLRQIMKMESASDENIRWLAERLHAVFIQNRMEFLILFGRADGSRYESFKDSIVDFARQRMAEAVDAPRGARLCGPLAVAVIEGLLDIFNHYEEGGEARLTEDLLGFLNYMLHGLMAARQMEGRV